MKRIFLFLIALSGIAIVNAQTFKFYYNDEEFLNEIQIVPQEGGVSTDYFDIENVSGNDVTFKVQLIKQSMAEDADVAMCFGGNCLATTMSDTLTLKKDSVMLHHFDLQYSYLGEDIVSTVIVNFLNQSEELLQSFTVKYVNENNLVNVAQKEKSVTLSAVARPNPAALNTTFNYSVPTQYKNAQLIVRNALGSTIKTFAVKTGAAGKVNFNTCELPNGVYFYSIVADGRQLITKKLIVKH